jgi:hypothetical protein
MDPKPAHLCEFRVRRWIRHKKETRSLLLLFQIEDNESQTCSSATWVRSSARGGGGSNPETAKIDMSTSVSGELVLRNDRSFPK